MERYFSSICLRCMSLLSRPGSFEKTFFTPINRSFGRARSLKTLAPLRIIQRQPNIFRLTLTNNSKPALLYKLAKRNFAADRGESTSGNEREDSRLPVWLRVLVVSGIGGALYFLLRDADHQKEIASEKTRYVEFSKAKLGGDWSLIDHHGKRRSSSEFFGEWVLIYFGFTHCPDICPEELEKLALIVKKFDERSDLPNLQPIFITLDPERDTPAAIKEYCAEFKSPRLLGFTGTEEEIRALAKKYRVYFGKGERDENNDYIVDHTIIIYLVNPKGEFVNYFGRQLDADQISESITLHINKYNELEAKKLL